MAASRPSTVRTSSAAGSPTRRDGRSSFALCRWRCWLGSSASIRPPSAPRCSSRTIRRRGFMNHARVKIFPALTDRQGHTVKYLQPRGSAPRLYFVTATMRQVLEDASPIWVVEGEKKAAAVAQLGLPAVGIAGVEGWHVKGSHELLADFDAIPLEGRVVELVPDGDYQTNV